jgi:predicted lipoprotein
MTAQRRPLGAELTPSRVALLVGVVAFLVIALLFGFTVVSSEEEAALTTVFDPVGYVDQSWDDVQTAIRDNAVPLADVLNRIVPEADGKAAKDALIPVAQELGLITTGEALVFRVQGTATVADVDTETGRGSIGLQVEGYDGPIKLRAWVGTRIPSDDSSIRDGVGFIQFGDFTDQTEYGKVAAEINKRVVQDLEAQGVAGESAQSLLGKQVDVTGALTIRTFNQPRIDVSTISVVPLEITAQ